MKIPSLTETIRSSNRVNEKQDSDAQSRKQGQQDFKQKKKEEELPVEYATDGKVEAAIEAFQADNQTRANGLAAEKIGNGPGLKVVLKDGTGAVIRQFTGEEFLKVREALSKTSAGRGKILDQKL